MVKYKKNQLINNIQKENIMELCAYSISLTVKDIDKSRIFYEKIGFDKRGGDQSQNWLIMRCGDTTIGLNQEMFENNIITFNPGWDQQCNKLESFTDIRELHKTFKSKGIEMISESIENEKGPSSFLLLDPDGNSILIDQHV